jgi:2-oxoglutarate ferredoxin oxidoreductase subunit delta
VPLSRKPGGFHLALVILDGIFDTYYLEPTATGLARQSLKSGRKVYSLHKTRCYIPTQFSPVQYIFFRLPGLLTQASKCVSPIHRVLAFFPHGSQGIPLLFIAIPGNSKVSAAGEGINSTGLPRRLFPVWSSGSMTAESPATPMDQQPPEPSSSPAKKQYDIAFYRDWCKACGLCMAFCPKKIILPDKNGKPVVAEPDQCIGCRFCEIHCPDFAITITERLPKRRRDDV